jgi:hypothetical protein
VQKDFCNNICHNQTFALHQKSYYSITSSALASSLSGTVSRSLLHGLEVDRKFERGPAAAREFRRFGALENPSSIDAGLAIRIGEACRVLIKLPAAT